MRLVYPRVRKKVSTPLGVERTRLRWDMVRSALDRYRGAHAFRFSIEGTLEGAEGVGMGSAFSGLVSGGARP